MGWRLTLKGSSKIPRIKFFTLAEIETIEGEEGDFTVTVKSNPRYVNQNCTACGKCAEVCPVREIKRIQLRIG